MARTFSANEKKCLTKSSGATKKTVKKSDANHPVSAKLDFRQLNVAAGGQFYEKAASRRSRHRLALLRSKSADDAVPLASLGRRASTKPWKPRPTSATNLMIAPEFEEDPHLQAIKGKPVSFKGTNQTSVNLQQRIVHRKNDATITKRRSVCVSLQTKSTVRMKQRR